MNTSTVTLISRSSTFVSFTIFLFSLKGLEFDIAVRKFLATFLLPKEAQQIDRLMEKFAERYYNDNKNETENVFGAHSFLSSFCDNLLFILQI
jgi:hypothetical protein